MNKTGTGNKGLDWFFVMGMLAAFPKTADLLSIFSPQILNDIFGMDMRLPYGMFCAAMVEGTVLFLHFDRRAHRVASAQTVKWILTGISGLCQVFDGYVTTDTISQMSGTLKLVLTFGIPALPLFISILIAMIGALPEGDEPVRSNPRVGLKNSLKALWEGEKENTEFSRAEHPSIHIGQPMFVPDEQENKNGKEPAAANFTNRQP
jgi:hypothetical protein